MSIYRRVFRYYRPFLPQTIVGLLLSLLGVGLNLLKVWPFKIIVDDFLRPNPTPRGDPHTWIPLLCLALVVIQFFWGVINWATNYILVNVGLQALLKLRTDLYAYLQSLSLKYHDVRRSSDLSFRVAYDSQSIQTIYNKGFTGIFGSVVTLIGTFAIMVRLDWQLTLLSLSIVPLIIAAIYFFAHRIPGTGKRGARTSPGGAQFHSNGARVRTGTIRGHAIPSASATKFAGEFAAHPHQRKQRAGD